jgi:hypothetical protein
LHIASAWQRAGVAADPFCEVDPGVQDERA